MGYSIVTFDEASFKLVPVYRRVWFMKGEKPRGVFFWSNKKLIIFGALIDGRKLFHEFYTSANSLTYLAFLDHFVKQISKRKKYVFLLDNASYHKSSVVKEYFYSLNKNIKVEFFPPYSPELNPTEACWKGIRQNVTNSTYYPTLDSMQESIENFLKGYFFRFNLSNYLCR
ncbi:MAG TPA: IS630 family transposase [Candidatus Nanoarchaeia archaeon]|nr:IS630 family transposase [Candidatus Nanoarchaeia archaeon]